MEFAEHWATQITTELVNLFELVRSMAFKWRFSGSSILINTRFYWVSGTQMLRNNV